MEEEKRIERSSDGALASAFQIRVVARQLPTGLFETATLFAGCQDFPIHNRESPFLQGGIESGGDPGGDSAGGRGRSVASKRKIFQCALKRQPASEHLRHIMEEVLFIFEAKLHDQ